MLLPQLGVNVSETSTTALPTLKVAVSPLRYCTHSKVTISRVDGATIDFRDAKKLEVYLHFYTRYEATVGFQGLPCVESYGCTHMQRQVLLGLSENGVELTGMFTPDSASHSYVMEVRVSGSA